MLFQPAIIALLLAAGLAVLMLAGAAPFAVQVIRHWDIASGSERIPCPEMVLSAAGTWSVGIGVSLNKRRTIEM